MRIYRRAVQEKVLSAIGLTPEEVRNYPIYLIGAFFLKIVGQMDRSGFSVAS